MTKTIEQRWQALDTLPETSIFQLVDADHPLKFYIGRGTAGEHLFLLVDRERPTVGKRLRSIETQISERTDGQWSLLLLLRDKDLFPVFALLCQDLIASARKLPMGRSGSSFVSHRLLHWSTLLEQGRTDLLGLDEIRGLFGELFFLSSHVFNKLGLEDGLNAWVGPHGAPQDFHTDKKAVEIKTVHPDANHVLISSEYQLFSEDRALYLVVLTLGEVGSDSPISLNEMVDSVREHIFPSAIASQMFEERLILAGYVYRPEYDSHKFVVLKQRVFEVNSVFPRIIPPMLISGICKVNYQLALAQCVDFEKTNFFLNNNDD